MGQGRQAKKKIEDACSDGAGKKYRRRGARMRQAKAARSANEAGEGGEGAMQRLFSGHKKDGLRPVLKQTIYSNAAWAN